MHSTTSNSMFSLTFTCCACALRVLGLVKPSTLRSQTKQGMLAVSKHPLNHAVRMQP